MDAAIAKRKEELYGVKIRGYLIQQPIQMVECDPGREHFIYNSWHMSGYERKLCDRGMCSFNPMVFRNLGAYYQHFLTVNVAMMCVTPMNQHGYFNFSLSNASARAVLDKADIVILEVNENLPWVYGGLDECCCAFFSWMCRRASCTLSFPQTANSHSARPATAYRSYSAAPCGIPVSQPF